MNPMTPASIDFVLPFLALLHIVLAVWSLVTLVHLRRTLGANSAFLWMLAIILIPILGSGAWLITKRGKGKPKSAVVTDQH